MRLAWLGLVVMTMGSVFPGADWEAEERALRRSLAAVEQRREEFPAKVYDSNVPLVYLYLEKARLRRESPYSSGSIAEDLAAARAALDRLAAGQVAFSRPEDYRGRPYVERAYLCRTDGSPQPYYVAVPEDYTPQRAWPLIIFLHGYVPDITKIDPWLVGDEVFELAKREGYLFVLPYGRRNSDFLGIGEVDTLRVLEEMRRFYRVDPDRVYLMGASMGGYGCWANALHYPDLFAAIAPLAGQADFYFWEGRDRATTPLFKRILLSTNNPLDLAENALNLPAYCQHGKYDYLVDVEHSRRLVARLQQLGYHIKYTEDPSPLGHYIYWELPCYQRAFTWLKQFRRAKAPRRVVYKTYHLKYNRAYWVRIEAFVRWARETRIVAEVVAPDRLVVETENVAQYALTPPEALVPRGRPVTVVTNGQTSYTGPWPETGELRVTLHQLPTNPQGLRKTPAQCGPARETFNGPFLVTYGTLGGPADDARLRANAERFVREWQAFADGVPPLKADVEVTPSEQARHHLVIFGEPSTHALLAQVADRLPLGIERGRYTVGEEVYEGPNLGLVLLYPHPEHPQRYLLINSGLFWGEPLPVNHKYDLLPDFIVFNDQVLRDARDPINQHLIAGFFNSRWELEEALISRWRE